MSRNIDTTELIKDGLPDVLISRIILDHRTVGDTYSRGDDPHIDIPLWKPSPQQFGVSSPPPPAWAISTGGLLEKKIKTSPTGWLKDQANDAENYNQPLFLNINFSINSLTTTSSTPSLFTTPSIKKLLKIAVFVCTDESTSMKILRNYNFSSRQPPLTDEASSKSRYPGLHGPKIYQLPETPGAMNNLSPGIMEAVFNADFSLSESSPDHLMVFAYAFIDRKDIENSFSTFVDLSNAAVLRRLFTGKLSAESVFSNGKLATTAQYYLDQGGSVYMGPVSLLYNGGTEGLTAAQIKKLPTIPVKGASSTPYTTAESERLTEVSVPNSVIQDFRVRQQLSNLQIDFSEPEKLFTQSYKQLTKKQFSSNKNNNKEVFFSDLMHTRNHLNQVKLTFAADVGNIYLHKSQYGKLLPNLSNKQREALATGLVFKKVTLMRQRLQRDGLSLSPSNLFDESNPIEIIAEGNLNKNVALSYGPTKGRFGRVALHSPLRDSIYGNSTLSDTNTSGIAFWAWFAGIDEEIAQGAPGSYQYGLRYVFEDKLEKFIKTQVATFRAILTQVEKFYKRSIHPRYYDNVRDLFSSAYRNSEMPAYEATVMPALVQFIELHQIFLGGDFTAKEDMALTLQGISCPTTGSPDGLLFVVNLMRDFFSLLESAMGSKALASNSSNVSNTYAPRRVQSKKEIFIQEDYWFPEIVDSYVDNNMGYEFLKLEAQQTSTSLYDGKNPSMINYNESAGIALVTYKQFETRANLETQKYFTSPNIKFKLPVAGQNSNKKIPTTSPSAEMYSYFSPSFIKTPNLGVLSTCPSDAKSPVHTIEYDKLNLYMLEIYKSRLSPLDASYKVDGKEVTGLTLVEKQEKYQLNQILGLKGVVFETSATEGVSILTKKNPSNYAYPPANFQLSQSAFGKQTESNAELQERLRESQTNPFIEENNFNDSLFFLTDADRTEGGSAFHWFLSRINNIKLSAYKKQSFTLNMPNQYKYLLKLNNPNDEALGNSSGEAPITNMVGIPTTETEWKAAFPATPFKTTNGFGYNSGCKSLDSFERKFGLWMNFFNLVEIQYFYGFAGGLNRPVFKKLTATELSKFKEENRILLCRMVKYKDIAKDSQGGWRNLSPAPDPALEMQIFDKYFFLGGEDYLTKFSGNTGFFNLKKSNTTMLKLQEQMNTMNQVAPKYLNTSLSTKMLNKVQQVVSTSDSEGVTNESY